MNDPDTEKTLREQFPEWKPKGGEGQLREFTASTPQPSKSAGSPERKRKYAADAITKDCADLAAMPAESGRNSELNRIAFKLFRFSYWSWIDEQTVYQSLRQAYIACGGLRDHGEGQWRATINGAREGAKRLPEPEVDWHAPPPPNVQIVDEIDGLRFDENDQPVFTPPVNGTNGHTAGRHVILKPLAGIVDDLPDWVWHYSGKGRIQLGTLAMLAGRPGAGKSTAARWFTAQLTNGTLDGIWKGQPINVAYLAAEEQIDVLVKPSLRAVGADMSRVWCIAVQDEGKEVTMKSIMDELALIEVLCEANIRVVIIDPIMATISGNADIYKNNEVRAHLEPYPRIAQAINGIVLGVAHLNKQAAKDVVAGINGSSAFGEVPRSVFGFAKDDSSEEGDRIMSQSKNSAGAEDLALVYRIETTTVTTEARGRIGEMAYFNIIGDSQVSVEDVMSAEIGQHSKIGEVKIWLHDFLEINGASPRQEVLRAAKGEGYSESTIKRAAAELKVHSYQGSPLPDKPRRAIWALVPPTPGGLDRSAGCEKDHSDDE